MVLRSSRRRCCVCFGLRRDESVKKGQIAHLDHNPANNDPDNLAWMCLDHHDEYDSKTSQTKSLQTSEVKAYRGELYETYAIWESFASYSQLVRFLAATITADDIVAGAIKVASRYRAFPEALVEEALTETRYESMDADRWVPHLSMLEDFQSWGLLTFELTELGSSTVVIDIEHNAICEELLARLRARRHDA